MTEQPPRQRKSRHFLQRDSDGTVRLRMRFTGEVASLFEEAAGEKPIMQWIYDALEKQADQDIEAARAAEAPLPPPE